MKESIFFGDFARWDGARDNEVRTLCLSSLIRSISSSWISTDCCNFCVFVCFTSNVELNSCCLSRSSFISVIREAKITFWRQENKRFGGKKKIQRFGDKKIKIGGKY